MLAFRSYHKVLSMTVEHKQRSPSVRSITSSMLIVRLMMASFVQSVNIASDGLPGKSLSRYSLSHLLTVRYPLVVQLGKSQVQVEQQCG